MYKCKFVAAWRSRYLAYGVLVRVCIRLLVREPEVIDMRERDWPALLACVA